MSIGDRLSYPWQEKVREVLIETHPEQLPKKIEHASTVVLMRLQEIAASLHHHEERDAVIQALRLLDEQQSLATRPQLQTERPQPQTDTESSRKSDAA